MSFKANSYTSRGRNSVYFRCASIFNGDSTHEGKNKLFPFENLVVKHCGVPRHLKDCLYIRIAVQVKARHPNENTQHIFILKNTEKISLVCLLTGAMIKLFTSNYPCLEYLFMVPKAFEPLKFCNYVYFQSEGRPTYFV